MLAAPQAPGAAADIGDGATSLAHRRTTSGATEEQADVDVGGLLAVIAFGMREARAIIAAHSTAARGDIDRHANALHARVKEQAKMPTTTHRLSRTASKEDRRSHRSSAEGDSRSAVLCMKKADTNTKNVKAEQTSGFAFYRAQLADAFDKWIRYADTLRNFESDRVKRTVAENSREARQKAGSTTNASSVRTRIKPKGAWRCSVQPQAMWPRPTSRNSRRLNPS